MNPETLKAWRARLSLGEAGMSAYLGVPVTTYRKWENGTRKPDAAPLRLFAVLGEVEGCAPELHARLIDTVRVTVENKPTKARKPRAATLAPATPEKRPSGPGCAAMGGVCDCATQGDCKFTNDGEPPWFATPATQPVPPWIHAADALPDWMNGGL